MRLEVIRILASGGGVLQSAAWNSASQWRRRDGLLVLEERKVRQSWSWVESRWILISDRRRVDLDLSHRLYSASELTFLLRDRGFAEALAYGDFDGSPYDEKADRLVVVARKP